MQVLIYIGKGTPENCSPTFGKTKEPHSSHEKRSTNRN